MEKERAQNHSFLRVLRYFKESENIAWPFLNFGRSQLKEI